MVAGISFSSNDQLFKYSKKNIILSGGIRDEYYLVGWTCIFELVWDIGDTTLTRLAAAFATAMADRGRRRVELLEVLLGVLPVHLEVLIVLAKQYVKQNTFKGLELGKAV